MVDPTLARFPHSSLTGLACVPPPFIIYLWIDQTNILEGHSLIWNFGLDSTVAQSSILFNAFALWERFHNKDAD